MMLIPFVSGIIHFVRCETVHRHSSGLMQFIGASFAVCADTYMQHKCVRVSIQRITDTCMSLLLLGYSSSLINLLHLSLVDTDV